MGNNEMVRGGITIGGMTIDFGSGFFRIRFWMSRCGREVI